MPRRGRGAKSGRRQRALRFAPKQAQLSRSPGTRNRPDRSHDHGEQKNIPGHGHGGPLPDVPRRALPVENPILRNMRILKNFDAFEKMKELMKQLKEMN